MKALLASAMKALSLAQKNIRNKDILDTNSFTEDSRPRSRKSEADESMEVETNKIQRLIESGEDDIEIINAEDGYSTFEGSDESNTNSLGSDAILEQTIDSLEQDHTPKSPPPSPFRK